MSDRNDQKTRPMHGQSNAETVRGEPTDDAGPVPMPTQIVAALLPAPSLEVMDILGVGGMGVVYRAKQTDLDRQIAFKRLIDRHTEDGRARFMREARLTAQLEHPNIVPVHLLDPGSATSPGGYAMKLVEGKTLRDLLDETAKAIEAGTPLTEEQLLPARLEIFLKVCDAIAFAHDRKILHRDLKPANVMIGAFGAVYVMDWGIARPFGEDDPVDLAAGAPSTPTSNSAITRAGAVVGSLPYMSPEQANGKNRELDAKSDQYSLGLLLHELITLRPAIRGSTELEVHQAAARGFVVPLLYADGRRPPRELRAIVGRATEFAPRRRYASVRDLADDVRHFLHNEAVDALPEGPVGRLLRFMSRHRRTTLMVFAGVLAIAIAAVSWTRLNQARREIALRDRGARLTALVGEVSRQAHRIDAELFQMEIAVESLGVAAEWALAGPEPTGDDARVYFDPDFKDAALRPADFTDKTAYRWPVSVEFPVIGVAPDVNLDEHMPSIRRIAPLRHEIRRLVAAAAVGAQVPLAAPALRTLLHSRKSPIDYAYVDLAAGIHMVWPGVDALPPGYDVRTASFYQMSANQHGHRWGAPYVDSTTDEKGDDLVLPCTRGLWSPAGVFLGVAGVEITVTKMVETSMVLPGRKPLRTSLVDKNGRAVVNSGDANKRFVASGKDEAIEFAELDMPVIAAAIRAGQEGLRELTRGGTPVVVAFARLDALGWYYVVEIDAATL